MDPSRLITVTGLPPVMCPHAAATAGGTPGLRAIAVITATPLGAARELEAVNDAIVIA